MEDIKHIIKVMSGVTDGGCEHCNEDDDIKHILAYLLRKMCGRIYRWL